MTLDQFNNFNEEEKKASIFDAKKITERFEELIKYELFQIDNFYVETKTSLEFKFKRVIETFALREVPVVYTKKITSA